MSSSSRSTLRTASVRIDPVGAAGQGDAVQSRAVRPGPSSSARFIARSPGPAGQDERAIDVEQDEFTHGARAEFTIAVQEAVNENRRLVVRRQVDARPARSGSTQARAGDCARRDQRQRDHRHGRDSPSGRDGTGAVVEITVIVERTQPGPSRSPSARVGKCEPDFAAAGGHFDPGPAGNPIPMPTIRSTWVIIRTWKSGPGRQRAR